MSGELFVRSPSSSLCVRCTGFCLLPKFVGSGSFFLDVMVSSPCSLLDNNVETEVCNFWWIPTFRTQVLIDFLPVTLSQETLYHPFSPTGTSIPLCKYRRKNWMSRTTYEWWWEGSEGRVLTSGRWRLWWRSTGSRSTHCLLPDRESRLSGGTTWGLWRCRHRYTTYFLKITVVRFLPKRGTLRTHFSESLHSRDYLPHRKLNKEVRTNTERTNCITDHWLEVSSTTCQRLEPQWYGGVKVCLQV